MYKTQNIIFELNEQNPNEGKQERVCFALRRIIVESIEALRISAIIVTLK
jgi:hypothetical protein